MKKTIIISIIALALPVLALAQEKTYYVPKKGDWSVGVTFNAASLGHKLSMQPKPGDFASSSRTWPPIRSRCSSSRRTLWQHSA